jgi:hypothetical protein
MLVGSVAGVTEGERVELGTLHDYDFDVKATVQPPILDPMATLIFFFTRATLSGSARRSDHSAFDPRQM